MGKTLPIIDRSRKMDETQWWDFWNTSYRAAEDPGEIARELFTHAAAIVNGITATGGGRLLEVACGSGALSRLLNYSSYHGLDISPAAIDLARQRAESAPWQAGAGRPAYEAVDFYDWVLPPQPFDIAVCVDALSSMRDQQLALRKIADSLRPSGTLVLTTINAFVYHRIKRTQSQSLASGPVSHWLTRSELRGLIQRAGFTVERFYTIMPRGNAGILRIINSWRLNRALGPSRSVLLRRLKEQAGLGQYFVVVARKSGTAIHDAGSIR